MRFDLADGFPLVTTKKLHIKSIVYECVVSACETNVRFLKEHGVSIWNIWADGEGELGPVYGHPVAVVAGRSGESMDQIQLGDRRDQSGIPIRGG